MSQYAAKVENSTVTQVIVGTPEWAADRLGSVWVGSDVKVGVGYSWSDFSDDLTDQSYTSHGPFLNLLGKF